MGRLALRLAVGAWSGETSIQRFRLHGWQHFNRGRYPEGFVPFFVPSGKLEGFAL
jgi:hypothetical protein